MNLLGKRIKEELVSLSRLKIIIIGCGVVGTALVEQLSIENNDITVIDTSAQKIQKITSAYDVMGIVGNGASFSIQKEAGIIDADLLIAVTKNNPVYSFNSIFIGFKQWTFISNVACPI